eukprot:165967-Chlamydomonas_euryale.AAC.1
MDRTAACEADPQNLWAPMDLLGSYGPLGSYGSLRSYGSFGCYGVRKGCKPKGRRRERPFKYAFNIYIFSE